MNKIKKPWARALKKFIPFLLMASAATSKSPVIVFMSAAMTYGYLWIIEHDAEEPPTPKD